MVPVPQSISVDGAVPEPPQGQDWPSRSHAERQRVVERRLSSLMAVLGGEHGADRPATAAQAGGIGRAGAGLSGRAGGTQVPNNANGRAVLGRLLDCICPDGSPVLHGLVLPGRSQPVEHLVVARRGLVVVCPVLVPPTSTAGEPGSGPAFRCSQPGARPGHLRSDAVRATLRRANALRRWLAQMEATGGRQLPADGLAVLAAVCSGPVPSGPVPVPVVIDDLWVGSLERLPAWLASGPGGSPGGYEREAIARALAAELGVGGQARS